MYIFLEVGSAVLRRLCLIIINPLRRAWDVVRSLRLLEKLSFYRPITSLVQQSTYNSRRHQKTDAERQKYRNNMKRNFIKDTALQYYTKMLITSSLSENKPGVKRQDFWSLQCFENGYTTGCSKDYLVPEPQRDNGDCLHWNISQNYLRTDNF